MSRTWKLGTAFDIGIYIHWTFLLLPLFVLFNTWGGGLAAAGYALVLVLAVFGCVVLHELGHALMARRFGIPTRDITLYPIGGVARLERMSERPWEEFCIALAGPAVNVAIAGVLGLFFFAAGIPLGDLGMTPLATLPLGVNLLRSLFAANVFLVLFNLLPAFPMDGGRVLRALLAVPLGHRSATEIAAAVGVVMAVLFGLASFWLGNPMLVLVAAFVFFAGQEELQAVRHREARRNAEPIDVLPAEDSIIEIGTAQAPACFSGFTWDSRYQVWVKWHNGQPVAFYGADAEEMVSGEWGVVN